MIHRAVLITRLVGPRPIALARTFAFLLVRRRRRRWLDAMPPLSAEQFEQGILRLPRIDLGDVATLPPALASSAERLRAEADLVTQHRVDYLGSGSTLLGPEVDWHTDFKSDYTWPRVHYRSIEITRLDDRSDAKVPWELSRGHQLLTLARAARLFQGEHHALEFERQLISWLDENPPNVGINWVTPMEVAIRAVNWIWAIATLEDWRPISTRLRGRVYRSLVEHARSIWCNLEGTPYLRSNHYVADILGLLAIGHVLPDFEEAAKWRRYAKHQLETSARDQVYPDGVSFEGSLPYHGLVLEMFLLATHICEMYDSPLSSEFDDRLRDMLTVSRVVRHGDGRIPVIGDQDSGRVLPAGFDRPPTHDNIIWLAAAILREGRPLATEPGEEVAWTLGVEAWRDLAAAPLATRPAKRAFSAGRIFVLESPSLHAVITCGDLGQKGNGGHGHNDTFSFEVSADDVPLIIDSGAYAYTFDVESRNAFRSTGAHNTVMVDCEEINPIDPGLVFELRQFARIHVERWEEEHDHVVFVAHHDGYRRLPGRVIHRRNVTLQRSTNQLHFLDTLDGSGRHQIRSFIHFAPGTQVDVRGDTVLASLRSATIAINYERVDIINLAEGWVSDRYGVRQRAPLLTADLQRDLPAEFGFRIAPVARSATGAADHDTRSVS